MAVVFHTHLTQQNSCLTPEQRWSAMPSPHVAQRLHYQNLLTVPTRHPAASHSNFSGEDSMPSHRNDQESVDEQPVDAIAMLKADHQRVKDLFAQYEGTSNAAAKGARAAEVFVELETH